MRTVLFGCLLIASFMTLPGSVNADEFKLLGMRVGPIPEESSVDRSVHGAYVIEVEPGSAAEQAGLQAGNIITSIAVPGKGRPAVTSAEEFADFVDHLSKRGHPVMLFSFVKPPSKTSVTRTVKLR